MFFKNYKFITILFFGIFFSACKKKEIIPPPPSPDLTRDQAAHQLHFPKLKTALSLKGIDIDQVEIFLRAFKHEEKLEIWAREKGQTSFRFFKDYDFCMNSGTLGPKRKEGDRQIPEGPYHINIYNPLSNFHLSMGLNYPNASDKILSHKESPGRDIYIHGGCMTIGCIPITNEKIKELYTLAFISHQQGQEQIPVHIFPFRMNDKNLKKWRKKHPKQAKFWKNIQAFYNHFEKFKNLIKFETNADGSFTIIP